MTGSLTRRSRICMTSGEWRELSGGTRKGLDEMGNAASGAPGCVSGPMQIGGAPTPTDVACGAMSGPEQ